MNASQLLKHFDRLAEAPDAVARLRRFILDLAVRGKLVEQDAGDEPAVELLKRIQVEKVRLVKAGKIKRLAEVVTDEFESPFPLPNHWAWTQLGVVAQYGVAEKADSNAMLPVNTWVLDMEDIEKDTSRLLAQVESEARPFSSTKTVFKQGDVLFGKLRPYLNKVIVADRDGVCTTEIVPIRGYCGLSPEYTRLVLRSSLTMTRVDRLMYGVKMPRLGTADAIALNYPLPPLAEQHRIVAKVDELMALCDQLEAAQQERERRRDRLAAASLQRLNQPAAAATPEEQREHVRFHLNHLPRLITRPGQIKAMRQLILNLAVRGKLVEREAGEASAAKLLTSIDANKLSLIKAGAIRKVAELSPLLPDDAVFEVPVGWVWGRLGRMGYTQTGTTPPTSMPECFGGQTPFVTPSDLTALVTTYEGKGLTDLGVKHSRLIAKNSVLMVCIGSTIGKVNTVDREVCCNQQINTITPLVHGMTGYIAIALRSDYFQQLVIANAGMGTLPILSKGKWEQLPLPLPPLAEQHRIVAKVDELMALCDKLEAQLTITQTDSRRLLEAVLA